MNLNFTYPAIFYDEDDYIVVEVPALGIEPFKIPQSMRSQMVDIVWTTAAQKVEQMIRNGIEPPASQTLDDLEVYEGNEKDAFLIELISE